MAVLTTTYWRTVQFTAFRGASAIDISPLYSEAPNQSERAFTMCFRVNYGRRWFFNTLRNK
ncbi:hypothetical protein DPMN_021721 [Dreissena polymorpha]|uniref:Uncharacterized protein n=1 Tax=Dreissena polymorpha TaxID=45954 RepID=A0A9D4NMM9_DREPO|nr:hypothetical protein DPMN_021721 [Dreissena polymorpha]